MTITRRLEVKSITLSAEVDLTGDDAQRVITLTGEQAAAFLVHIPSEKPEARSPEDIADAIADQKYDEFRDSVDHPIGDRH